MSDAAPNHLAATARLELFRPPAEEANVARWRINGFPAAVFIWTAAEWERLTERPADAQYYPCGVWAALRMG